jgi:hypothetical protein
MIHARPAGKGRQTDDHSPPATEASAHSTDRRPWCRSIA